mmetsp:Transcript_20920/g.58238  ORF Transcript_20920/g.58238 Transcript_20920/m.58238 type:complete len:288 (+) Transcript_20920:23-886(+)
MIGPPHDLHPPTPALCRPHASTPHLPPAYPTLPPSGPAASAQRDVHRNGGLEFEQRRLGLLAVHIHDVAVVEHGQGDLVRVVGRTDLSFRVELEVAKAIGPHHDAQARRERDGDATRPSRLSPQLLYPPARQQVLRLRQLVQGRGQLRQGLLCERPLRPALRHEARDQVLDPTIVLLQRPLQRVRPLLRNERPLLPPHAPQEVGLQALVDGLLNQSPLREEDRLQLPLDLALQLLRRLLGPGAPLLRHQALPPQLSGEVVGHARGEARGLGAIPDDDAAILRHLLPP